MIKAKQQLCPTRIGGSVKLRPHKRRQQPGGDGIYLPEKNVHAGWAAVRAAKQCPHLPRLTPMDAD